MKKLMIVSIIALLFISCKKERTFHITAKNAATGEPYPGLSYNIERSWSGSFENKYKSVGSGVLDANGEAFFSKRLHKNSSYSISVGSPENTCYFNSGSLSPKGEKNFKAEFEFTECAYSKLIINNVNCNDATDKFVLFQKNQIGSINGNFGWEHMGCAYWETNGYSDIAMGNVYFRWVVTRNGNSNTYYDTVYYAPGEYKTYEINY
jgi:hypothetical protein